MSAPKIRPPRWWVLGAFPSEVELLEAVGILRSSGFTGLDAHSPVPVEGLSEALDLPPSPIPRVALVAGLGGAALGYTVQWFTNAVDWPLNVGGRLAHSAPSFIPITFETGVLVTGCAIVAALIALFGFPRLSHPVFELEAFRSASVDGFWISFATVDPAVREKGLEALRGLGARDIGVVEDLP
jgi:hypothetical protein